jgi:hypothetical protein
MTAAELVAWNAAYDEVGITARELMTLYHMNRERIAAPAPIVELDGVFLYECVKPQPLGMCPELMRTARLTVQLGYRGGYGGHTFHGIMEGATMAQAHMDNHYGGPSQRYRLFRGTLIDSSALTSTNRKYSADENLHSGSRMASHAVRGWMNSPRHRINMLSAGHTYVGVGNIDTVFAQLFN